MLPAPYHNTAAAGNRCFGRDAPPLICDIGLRNPNADEAAEVRNCPNPGIDQAGLRA